MLSMAFGKGWRVGGPIPIRQLHISPFFLSPEIVLPFLLQNPHDVSANSTFDKT